MKLNAATRLLAADSKARLQELISGFDNAQKKYFIREFPRALVGWFSLGFERGLKTDEILLEGSTTVVADYGLAEFKKFILMMVELRKIFPPHTTSGPIHRMTAIKEVPTGKTVLFKNAEQFRSLTSWTLNSKPEVLGRDKIPGMHDVILTYHLASAKNVLFDYPSIMDLADAILGTKGREIDSTHMMYPWNRAEKQIKDYKDEREVALYLNANQEIECTWRPL
jgi:hypothetical protein